MRRIYPGAEYAPIPEAEGQAPIVPVLVIFHTIVGAAAGAESTMRGEAWTGEAHVVLPFAKPGRQLVPFDRRADCNWQVNSWTTPIPLVMADGRIIPAGTVCGAISIETEDDGTPEDTEWTAEQVEWLARFTAWAHDEHGIPLDTPATPFHPGVGYHSLPGKNTLKIWDEPGAVPPYGTMLDAKGRTVNVYNPWTNTVGKSCPGAARIAQFPHVLELARRYAGGPAPQPPPPQEEDDDMNTARIWGHPEFTNRWLVGTGSAMHLSGNLAKSYIDAGVPQIIEAHDQTLKTVLFQCGLTSADLVRNG